MRSFEEVRHADEDDGMAPSLRTRPLSTFPAVAGQRDQRDGKFESLDFFNLSVQYRQS